MISKREADEVEVRVKKDFQLLHELMKKFGIDADKKNAYFRLLVVLARKHYPNGVRRRGRPRSICVSRFVKQLRRGKCGRPASKQKTRKDLLELVDKIKSEHRSEGHGSDKKALEILVEELAIDRKQSKLRMREKYLTAWQKDLSRARADNRKKPKNT